MCEIQRVHAASYEEVVTVPRAAKFPVELRLPTGFKPHDLTTWPAVDGRLEFYDGRLWYMPPSGGAQGLVVADVTAALMRWAEDHDDFVVATNEVGMMLGKQVRAADAAIWRRSEFGRVDSGLRRHAPVVAFEVIGEDDSPTYVRTKASWYFRHGVRAVCFVFPESKTVEVQRRRSKTKLSAGQRLALDELPAFEIPVGRLFRQLG